MAATQKTFEQFYEGFTNCRATQEGIKDEKISSKTKKTLDTYFKRAYAGTPSQPHVQSLPPPYDGLMPLQDKSGQWTDLQAVLDCLDMPEGTTLDQNLEEWEEATVFAVAAIRQRPELADRLMEAHDRAFAWVSSRGYIAMAIEMIFCFREPEYKKAYKDKLDRSGLPVPPLSDFGTSTVAPSVGQAESSSMSTLQLSSSLDGRSSIGVVEDPEEAGRAAVTIDHLSPASPAVGAAHGAVMEQAAAAARHAVETQQDRVVQYAAEFDRVRAEVRRCVARCSRLFQSAPTHELRNRAFDELTCMLGPGMRPLPGVPDWRRYGAPSFRGACVDVLCSVHVLAGLRLDAQEAHLTWRGRPAVNPELLSELRDARWTFTWEGRDLVLAVLQSLDWLQENPLVTGWYGRPFSFTANPLTLPLTLVQLYNTLDMEGKCTEQLDMRPFKRSLCGAEGAAAAWKQREFLLKWQPRFEAACAQGRLSSLWPATPETLQFAACEEVFTALVVLFVKGKVHIMRSVGHEQTTLYNRSLVKAMRYTVKTELGPAAGKKSSKWRGTIDLSAGRDISARQAQSYSAGSQYRPLPKLKRRPTMPWPKDDSVHSEEMGDRGGSTALSEADGEPLPPAPLQVETPLELHLSIKTSPEKKKIFKIKKKVKPKPPPEPAVPEVITLALGKAASSHKSFDGSESDDNSSATSVCRSSSMVKLEPITAGRDKHGKKKNSKKGAGGRVSSPIVAVKKKPTGITRRNIGSPIEGGREVISRASFPTDVKLTRKVAHPAKAKKKALL